MANKNNGTPIDVGAQCAIPDQPILSVDEDLLGIEKYAKGLANFIRAADTPLTIGLQGEWGTGKTSLMNLLQAELIKKDKNVLTSWVNTWKQSVFEDQRLLTPNVLRAMLKDLEKFVPKEGEAEKSSQQLRAAFTSAISTTVRIAAGVANQISIKQLGVDARKFQTSDANDNNESSKQKTGSDVSELKEKIELLINGGIDGVDEKGRPNVVHGLTHIEGKPDERKRVVFFIDDLDRIDPEDAIILLEGLKNVFDIKNCIFVLAIDFEVVIKGLKEKFGKQEEGNEREYRSFFDKIIQVPFTMPVDTYNPNKFLKENAGIFSIANVDDETLTNYGEIVKHTIGSNPRSLKRLANYFLLMKIMAQPMEEENADNANLFLFALVALQIRYPAIYKFLVSNPDFMREGSDWDEIKKTYEVEIIDEDDVEEDDVEEDDVEEDDVELEREKTEAHGSETSFSNSDFSRDWRKLVAAICEKDNYLKKRTSSIIGLIALLGQQAGSADKFEKLIDSAKGSTSITSVDTDVVSVQDRRRPETVEEYIDSLRSRLGDRPDYQNYKEFLEYIYERVSGNKIFSLNFGVRFSTLDYSGAGRKRNPGSRTQLFYFRPPNNAGGFVIHIQKRYLNRIPRIINDHFDSFEGRFQKYLVDDTGENNWKRLQGRAVREKGYLDFIKEMADKVISLVDERER